MPKKLIFILVFILFLGILGFVVSKKIFAPEKIHYHAGFIVFEDSKKIDFSDTKYMYVKPCSINGKEEGNEDEQIEKAHLHDNVGDVVHIEEKGAIWKDLFVNIKYPLGYSQASGYINGKKIENWQSQGIKSDDVLVVLINTSNNITEDLKQIPTKEYIEKMAKKSTTCGD